MIQVLTGDEESLKRIKRFRCSVCQYDATLAITLLTEAAIEESKITTQTAIRTHTCPGCGTVAQLQAWTEREEG